MRVAGPHIFWPQLLPSTADEVSEPRTISHLLIVHPIGRCNQGQSVPGSTGPRAIDTVLPGLRS
ncbi:hypothetical protein BAURA63_00183 [Brevibacterium aurantiacum]|uniref:Uncharacterized protein n=1 Tax=Brevibacterium aurantiacum TaxID=273384 RepID=A0A2H1I0G4_BREAU|nr:hypothetical protein BAURA63_00183 [Brevibacterium aurantiacum]SMX68638.1 hypothetical protein BAUR9175_00754 [Brevibacterium aurantiacum]SMX78035.1 hypothetical protein BAURA86_00924 [Brevibacterium aurantiacum]